MKSATETEGRHTTRVGDLLRNLIPEDVDLVLARGTAWVAAGGQDHVCGALAAGVIAFLGAWNQYVWPRAVTDDPEQWATVQIALRSIASANIDQLNIGFAAALIAALPILILLIFFQRHLIRGLTAGAVKG